MHIPGDAIGWMIGKIFLPDDKPYILATSKQTEENELRDQESREPSEGWCVCEWTGRGLSGGSG